jgi:hypothetical protein
MISDNIGEPENIRMNAANKKQQQHSPDKKGLEINSPFPCASILNIETETEQERKNGDELFIDKQFKTQL